MKIFITLFLFPVIMYGQVKKDFKKLIEETNHYLTQYSKLTPFGNEYYPISEFGLSKKEIKELLIEADYPATLPQNKDSIESLFIIFWFASFN